MTVKLKNEIYKSNFENLCKKHNVIIDNVNILGYYDLILPDNSKFYEMFTKFEESKLFSSVEIISHAKLLSPNDPGFSDQYYLENSSGYPDINIQGAWNITKGSPSVIVAVIDQGVDDDNTDIDGNIWTNFGWDYVEDDSDPSPANNEHHGTSVAGIIAAETNNGTAVAGIAGGWNNAGCKIMSLRLFYYDINGNEKTASQYIDDAIIYAAQNGAKIINMSFALDFLSDFGTIKPSIDAAIEYAYKSKGCLLIASSGNNPNKQGIYYPARNPNVMAIGGLFKDWTSYGRFGPELEIVAPAVGIYTLLTSNQQNPANWGLFDNSTYGNGTSAASPQVAGVASLIFSKYSNWINYDVRKILNESAYDLGDQLKFGNGLLQADNALIQANPTYQANNNQPQNVILSGAYGSNPIITWNELPGYDIDYYNIYRAQIVSGVYSHFHIVASVNPSANNTNSWTDNSVIRMVPKFAPSTHFYRVTSMDINGVESVTSNEVNTGSNWASKKAIEDKHEVTYQYNLGNNYPNPFNPSTKIQYSLKEKGFVSLIVYDVLGRVVKELVNEQKVEGKYEIIFDTKDQLSSGVYYYTMKVNNFYSSKKLLILK